MLLLLKFLSLLSLVVTSEQEVVSTAQGQIRGVAHDGYVSYVGIPYASVSDEMGRFKSPGLAPIWSGIRDPRPSRCTQTSVEECLELDVHVPAGTTNWPVLVWVAGGSGPYYPEKLVKQGIIVVIVNHRHGLLGFLCTDDENIPGNAGVKDVVSSLRWVRDNIVAFKGNPAKVVIAGQSFGAAMVEALMLSTMARGLYHAVILQSGSILCPWAFNYDAHERAMALTNMSDDAEDMAKVLLDAKIEDLVANSNKLDVPYFPYGICLEKPIKNEERVLSEAPYELMSRTKVNSVPMIIGFNSDEAYVFASVVKEAKLLRRLEYSQLLPAELEFLNEREKMQVSREVEEMYFKNGTTFGTVLAFHRDAYFVSRIHRSVSFHASSSAPVYYYQFSHVGRPGIQSEPGVKKAGAAHSDELAYLFSSEDLEGKDGIVQQNLIKLWTSFVMLLNPNTPQCDPTWEATSSENHRVLDIGAELRMIEYPLEKVSKMWDEIYEKYYYGRKRTKKSF